MNRIYLSICAACVAFSSFAGGLLTNTNQNAAFLRNPARDAAIAIDGVYSNPAGTAFLPQGFHLSLSWQAAIQKREITSNFTPYLYEGDEDGTKYFEGKSTAPVIPSFQAVYVINDKWSASAQFAVGGGGGKCEFEQGLPMFEKLVYSTLATTAAQYGASLQSYKMNQQLTGKQYYYGFQLGGTYRPVNNVSVFAGLRGVLANCSYSGAITNISANLQLPAALGGSVMPVNSDDLVLDCKQKDFGFTPILGIDVNLGKLNLAAKYEFRTKISMENESSNTANVDAATAGAYADGAIVRTDIPAILALGAQYSVLPNVRIGAGFHYYFDKDAKGTSIKSGDNTWEGLLGVEWDVNKKWLVSAGVQRTQYGFEDSDMSDISFNISSTALCIGGAYKFNEKMRLNVGYMHSFYGKHTVEGTGSLAGMSDVYTRKNDVVGVSFDISF